MSTHASWPLLVGQHITLRSPVKEETPIIMGWLDDPETAQFLNPENPFTVRPGTHRLRMQKLKSKLGMIRAFDRAYALANGNSPPTKSGIKFAQSAKAQTLAFSIVGKDDQKLLGVIALQISLVHLIGTIRTVVAPSARDRHIGREAKMLILKFAFEDLPLEKVCSEMLADNVANRKVNESCGFKVEGILKNHVMLRGVRRDLLCMAIQRGEWEARAIGISWS